MTVEELTKLAMQEMQVIAAGVDPTSDEYELGLKRFNTLVTSLQNDMVFLVYQDVAYILTVSGRREYPTKIYTHRVRGFNDRNINMLSRRGYDQYNNSGSTGRTDVFIEYNYDVPIIQFPIEPAPDKKYFYRRDVVLADLVNGQEIPLHNPAIEMLILGLAYKLCPAYGVEVSRRDSIKTDYMEELNKYRQAQTTRIGDEIVAPIAMVVI